MQVIGEKENGFMRNKIEYSEGPIEDVRVVTDFLPKPEELVFREETVKITIALSKASIAFFKQEATKHNVSYQKMIRRLLDDYAFHHSGE